MPSVAPNDSPLAVRLSRAQIELLRQHGEEPATIVGDVLFRKDDPVIVVGSDGLDCGRTELAAWEPGEVTSREWLVLSAATWSKYQTQRQPVDGLWRGEGHSPWRASPLSRCSLTI